MKTLIGIDEPRHYRKAMELLARLDFPAPEWHVVNVSNPIPVEFATEDATYETELRDAMAAASEAILDNAVDEACGYGAKPAAHALTGNAAGVILREADALHVDLVAIGSRKVGSLKATVLGSVGRALAIGSKKSFLVAKEDGHQGGKIRAVFAMDHSDYCTACLDKLIQLGPKGLQHVLVVTASDLSDDTNFVLKLVMMNEAREQRLSIESILEHRCKEAVDKLRSAGIPAGYMLRSGHVRTVLREAMEQTGAELMILGAQGHGFIDRLMAGSIALHEVIVEPYSTLVLRAQPGLS